MEISKLCQISVFDLIVPSNKQQTIVSFISAPASRPLFSCFLPSPAPCLSTYQQDVYITSSEINAPLPLPWQYLRAYSPQKSRRDFEFANQYGVHRRLAYSCFPPESYFTDVSNSAFPFFELLYLRAVVFFLVRQRSFHSLCFMRLFNSSHILPLVAKKQ